MGRLLIVTGLILVVAGLLINVGLPIGRLPGDFTLRRGGLTIYVPLMTSILASLVLTLLAMFFWRR
jgi:hypothetical protein